MKSSKSSGSYCTITSSSHGVGTPPFANCGCRTADVSRRGSRRRAVAPSMVPAAPCKLRWGGDRRLDGQPKGTSTNASTPKSTNRDRRARFQHIHISRSMSVGGVVRFPEGSVFLLARALRKFRTSRADSQNFLHNALRDLLISPPDAPWRSDRVRAASRRCPATVSAESRSGRRWAPCRGRGGSR